MGARTRVVSAASCRVWLAGVTLAAGLIVAPQAARAGSLDPVNLALGKSAYQSSTMGGADASRAVDGNVNATFTAGSVTHTNADLHSWWEVDLGEVRQIGRVEITNRIDCCSERLIPFILIVADIPIIDSDITDTDASAYPGIMRTTISGQVQATYFVPVNRSGRYVRIALVNQNYLSLAEVKVIEGASGARGRTSTQQSSTANLAPGGAPADASRAVDANINGAIASGSVAATQVELRPWWQVDMGMVHQIREVQVFFATDCCSTVSHKPGFYVWVSATPITADPVTTAVPGVQGFWMGGQGYPTVVPINLPGRYIRIELDNRDALALAEVQVWPVARGSVGGHGRLSSTATNSNGDFAIDLDTTITGKTATTQSQTEPFWELDLGATRYLETVKLWSASGNTSLATYNLFVSNTPFTDSSGLPVNTVAGMRALPGVSSWVGRGTNTYSATAVMRQGRYVRVMLDGTNKALSFAEAEVVTTEGYAGDAGLDTNGELRFGVPFVRTLYANGYFPTPNTQVAVYAFRPSSTGGGGSYSYVGLSTTGSSPILTSHAAAPLYSFGLDFLSAPTDSWLQGGVGDYMFTAFDNNGFTATPMANLDVDGSENVFWPDIRAVSVDPTPDADATKPAYLDSPMGTTPIANYVNTAVPYTTYAAFDNAYLESSGVALAVYYNKGDLGIGRAMRCNRISGGYACAVDNYAAKDGSGHVIFGDQAGASNAFQNEQVAATVAMTIADGSSVAKFAAYDGVTGHQLNDIALDTTGHNTRIPNNCMACHGGSGGDSAGGFPRRATFLPFDLSSLGDLAFSTVQSQAESFRKLNAIVAATTTTPAIVDLINGWYGGAVNTVGATFNANYIPAGWSITPAQKKVYSQVVAPYCRTCHIAQKVAEGGLDFLRAKDVEAFRAAIIVDTCQLHRMPHAQQTLKRFWTSGARAQVLGYFGRHDFAAELCTP